MKEKKERDGKVGEKRRRRENRERRLAPSVISPHQHNIAAFSTVIAAKLALTLFREWEKGE